MLSTGWVKPARQTKGLDPLGSQAPGIRLYSQLLPGITNVTDRARYYTFYPWLIWALHEDGCTAGDEFIELFRRGDCLFSLIAHRHLHTTGDESDEHSAALIGSNNLRSSLERLKDGQAANLKEVAAREGGGLYFKNRLGGLGQYYLGPLRDAGILNGGGSRGVQCDEDLGVSFAQAMDGVVDRSLFVRTMKKDTVRGEDLDKLSAFCPCHLASSTEEQTLLVDFLANRGILEDSEQVDRRLSIRLVLQLADALASKKLAIDELSFRGVAYSGALSDGSTLDLPDMVEAQREKWGVYEGGDLLSVACLGLFWSMLNLYEVGRTEIQSSAGIGYWFSHQTEISGVLDEIAPGSTRVIDATQEVATQLPDLWAWREPDHELGMADSIVALSHGEPSTEACAQVLRCSTTLILGLMARGPIGPVLSGLFPPGYTSQYPVNLASMRQREEDTWRELTIRELVGWIAEHWLVDNHIHVAMRKLSTQSEDTFRIRWGDHGYEVAQISPAVPTSPRFRQLLRVLMDTGVLVYRKGKLRVVTEFKWLKDFDGTE
jgi:hypothetical protein